MKAKTKVVLLSSALALGTAGVFGASTFAWFTRNTQAQMSISTATIKSSASNLSVTLIPISNKIDNAMEPIPVSGTEGNSYSADFTMLDYSSAFGDEFVDEGRNQVFAGEEAILVGIEEGREVLADLVEDVMGEGEHVHRHEGIEVDFLHVPAF
jgi:hypothetical protein